MEYIVLLTSNSTDPIVKGPFKDKKSAEGYLNKDQSTWSERDWYIFDSHIIKLNSNKSEGK